MLGHLYRLWLYFKLVVGLTSFKPLGGHFIGVESKKCDHWARHPTWLLWGVNLFGEVAKKWKISEKETCPICAVGLKSGRYVKINIYIYTYTYTYDIHTYTWHKVICSSKHLIFGVQDGFSKTSGDLVTLPTLWFWGFWASKYLASSFRIGKYESSLATWPPWRCDSPNVIGVVTGHLFVYLKQIPPKFPAVETAGKTMTHDPWKRIDTQVFSHILEPEMYSPNYHFWYLCKFLGVYTDKDPSCQQFGTASGLRCFFVFTLSTSKFTHIEKNQLENPMAFLTSCDQRPSASLRSSFQTRKTAQGDWHFQSKTHQN